MARKKREVPDSIGATLPETLKVNIQGPELSYCTITIVGETPLMVNHFHAKSITEIEDKQMGKAKRKKAFRNKEEEFRNSLYPIDLKKKVYGVPAAGLKKAAISACKFVDEKATILKGSFFVLPDAAGNLVTIKGSSPVMDEGMVRVGPWGNKVAMPRYRGRFDRWEITFKVKYNKRIVSPEMLLNLFENAGFSIGICEWRPEKDGNYGMFHVKRA